MSREQAVQSATEWLASDDPSDAIEHADYFARALLATVAELERADKVVEAARKVIRDWPTLVAVGGTVKKMADALAALDSEAQT